MNNTDTIVARATAPGEAAIAVIRLDGAQAWPVAARIWKGHPNKAPQPRQMQLGTIQTPDGTEIDRALMVYFRAPHSYTGNDLVELHTHGSPAVTEAVIQALLEAGARLADPGEFTRRAFFNDRLDLAQAEGVANLIASRTEAAARIALAQLDGVLSTQLNNVRENLLDVMAEIEARLDFPEEDIEVETKIALLEKLNASIASVDALLATARRGRLLRDGARTAIAGRPNAGKSSLFNALLGLERALVTPHAGTTRDTIEATIDLDGMPIVLVDTAGMRKDSEADAVESLGIERTRAEIQRADLVLFILDVSRPWNDDDIRLASNLTDRPVIAVLNKCDLPRSQGRHNVLRRLEDLNVTCRQCLEVSALDPASLQPLESALKRALLTDADSPTPSAAPESPVVINQRHSRALQLCRQSLLAGQNAVDQDVSGDLAVVDLREALDHVNEILGLRIDDAILDRIFSRFCLGK